MQSHDSSPWSDNGVLEAFSDADAAYLRNDRPDGAITLTHGNVDVSAFISDGRLYVEVPLSGILETLEPSVSIQFGYLETGVSETWRTTLSPDGVRSAVLGTWMALTRVVRDSFVGR